MTGWLIYHEDNVARNRFFINRWLAAGTKQGAAIELVLAEDLCFGIRNNKPFLLHRLKEGRPDFAVMRTQHQALSRHLESMGIPVFNSARTAELCNDKRKTHALLAGQVPMMDTAYADAGTRACPFPYPVVVKAAHSCGGRAVYRADDEAAFCRALHAVAPDSAVVQPMCDTPGRDVRVYMLGDKVIASMLRFSDTDFRSNVGQGGSSQPYAMTAELKAMVDIIAPHFDIGLVGIDFIFHQGQLLFNEVEDAVGTRMLYMHTDLDIVDAYLEHILAKIG